MAIRCYAIILYCALCFGLVGGILGLVRGFAVTDPGFDPMASVGLSAFRGFVIGAVIGSVAVLVEALFRSLRERRALGASPALLVGEHGRRSMGMWFFLALVAVFTATACGGAIGFVVGGITAEESVYQRYVDAKLDKIRPVLQEPQFAGVEADYSSAAQVYLTGTADSEEARQDLEARIRFLFGDEEAREMLWRVEVAKQEKETDPHSEGARVSSRDQPLGDEKSRNNAAGP